MKMDCSNCKHAEVAPEEPPCDTCFMRHSRSNWESIL